MFYVYLLHSERDAGLYIGFSTDLRRRLNEHKNGAAQATNFRGPWNLIYYEAYAEEADALGRERYLKSGGGRKFLRSQLRNYFATHPLRTNRTEPFGESRGPQAFTRKPKRDAMMKK